MDEAEIGYVGKASRGVPHTFGWVWRTVDDYGEAAGRIVGTAGLPPVTMRPARFGADEVEPITSVEAQSAWEHARGFITMLNLMQGCPSCQAHPAPDAQDRDTDDWEDRLDWGDADLRAEAERTAFEAGWWQGGDSQWYPPLSDRSCSHCGGWHEQYNATSQYSEMSGPLVPALPLDVQPAAWLRELLTELVARVAASRRVGTEERLRWQTALEAMVELADDLPDLPPEGWWPEPMLRSEFEGVVAVRARLDREAARKDVDVAPTTFDGEGDDEPF